MERASTRQSTRLKKSIFSKQDEKPDPQVNTFNSVSSNFLIRNERTRLESNLRRFGRNEDISNLKNNCTQTSKTIIELAKLECGDISPDSLSGSPKAKDAKFLLPESFSDESTFKISTFSDSYTLDGSCDASSSVCFSRKNSIMEYQKESGDAKDSQSQHFNSPVHTERTLTEVFLAKKHNSNENTMRHSDRGGISTNRSEFLQQMSPLRKLMEGHCQQTFESQSFIESSYQKESSRDFLTSNQSRFKVKAVSATVETSNETHPVRYFCQNIINQNETEKCKKAEHENVSTFRNYQRRRSNSFMSPTVSSSNKDCSMVIKNTSSLISPTMRGRSASPKKKLIQPSASLKVPYIDQSSTNLTCRASGTEMDLTANTNFKSNCEDTLRIDLDFQSDLISDSRRESPSTTYGDRKFTSIFASLNKIRSPDWNAALRGLAEIIDISRQLQPEFLYPYMAAVNQRLLDLLRSPRSHVCRTACQAAGHLFEFVKDTRRPEFDDIVEILLFKTADSNKFIRQDANLALDCMVTHITAFHAVRALCAKGPTHKNHLVRTATVRLLICVAVIASPESLFNPNNSEVTRKNLILNMAKFIVDKNFETRKLGERLYKVLCKDSRFDLYMKKYLNKDTIIQMKSQLKVIHQQK